MNYFAQSSTRVPLPWMTGELTMPLHAGNTIGNYTLTERIGNPNMGDIWRAVANDDPARVVAIKGLSSRFENDAAMRRRFQTECAIHHSLRHPGIIPTLEPLAVGGQCFLIMPFIGGGSLEDQLRLRPIPPAFAIPLAIQALDALNYVHLRGFIHRDVKPSNILCQGQNIYLTDFGIALDLFRAPAAACDFSGTIAYMSPEQIQSPQMVDQRSDVYGFGCVLYEMITGHPPFPLHPGQAATDDQIKFMHVTQPPIPPRVSDVRLEQIILTALHKDPSRRFAGCGAFALALRHLDTAPRPGLFQRAIAALTVS